MQCVEYPFYTFQGVDGFLQNAPRVYLPIRLSNPDTEVETDIEFALVDTGADSSVVPGSLACELGHQLKHEKVKTTPTFGINGTHLDTYGHTFRMELLSPDAKTVVWSNDKAVVDCVDTNIPILLGTKDFLANFRITIDYLEQKVILQW